MLYWDAEIWKKMAWYANESGCTFKTKGVHWTGVENGSRITLPVELNDSTLSSSCLKAVSPLSMLQSCFTLEYVAYSLRGCSQPSFPLRKAVQKSTLVVGHSRTSSKLIVTVRSSEVGGTPQVLSTHCFAQRSWVLAQPTFGTQKDAWKLFSFWICYIQLEVAVYANEKEKGVQSWVQICWKITLPLESRWPVVAWVED